MTKDKLIAEMNQAMQIVGYVNSWTQPISTRVMMQDTGIQTPVGIKVKGPDLGRRAGDRAAGRSGCCETFPGTQSVIAERISQGYFVDAQLDLERMARARRHRGRGDAHGAVRHRRRQRRRHPAGRTRRSCRWRSSTRRSTSTRWTRCANTPVVTDDGRSVPLGDIADVAVREAPEMIRNDNGELAGYIYVYLRDVTGAGVRGARAASICGPT